ncbi:Hypothetical gene [Listeria ivanovii subsp. ivanovii PAM 55]|uniref:Uncharacterized protein n=1 Tax=Listeria ivanovii (strain ATCC BAA-678 / PAM 55) TaxID=881621 RepID=G2ZBA4_LISIP|nr:Hypothetical gene [Listeria ivanovii subsp. ivanovii PAM 55]
MRRKDITELNGYIYRLRGSNTIVKIGPKNQRSNHRLRGLTNIAIPLEQIKSFKGIFISKNLSFTGPSPYS